MDRLTQASTERSILGMSRPEIPVLQGGEDVKRKLRTVAYLDASWLARFEEKWPRFAV